MLMHRPPNLNFGAELIETGVRFRLWAPNQRQVSVVIEGGGAHRMRQAGDGWHELITVTAGAGTRYKFRLEDGTEVPDPASRCQPADVHGPSEVIDRRAYQWHDQNWRGRPWEETVFYELHLGSFTPQGTFRSAIERLDYLAELGVTAIEIMPVADFPGNRNWGYDGVLLFAPDSSYGRPDDFKALVDAAHGRGISVYLDVVYNHFGPDGNYLSAYSPVFTARHQTPWGDAVNYDAEGSEVIREFVIANAGYWIEDFHLDGLRLDAVHAIKDDSDRHVLDEIADRVRAKASRPVHLVLENEENEASRLRRKPSGDPSHYTAQWNDDVHHVLHVAATGERAGYYSDYGKTDQLARALAEGFAYQGEVMPYRGSARGEPSRELPPTAFIAFIQNHDQVGNRAFGDRITAVAPPEAVRAIAAVYLLLPQIPMLFMGEEYGATQPFPFFCDFDAELGTAVREGRRAEFAKFPEFHDPEQRARIPDPTAIQTFASSKLNWTEATQGEHARWLALYRELLAIRHRDIIPRLAGIAGNAASYQVIGPNAVAVQWRLGDGARLQLTANLGAQEISHGVAKQGRVLWGSAEARDRLPPWSVIWQLDDRPIH